MERWIEKGEAGKKRANELSPSSRENYFLNEAKEVPLRRPYRSSRFKLPFNNLDGLQFVLFSLSFCFLPLIPCLLVNSNAT